MSSQKPVHDNSFYEFRDPFQTRPYRLKDRPPLEALAGTRGHRLAHGKLCMEEPIPFQADTGNQAADILWSQMTLLFCVSGRLVRLLKENGITGWSTYPVQVYDRKGVFLPDYHGFAVTGGMCAQDFDRSVPFEKKMPSGRLSTYYRGLYFHENQWDGSDLFWLGVGTPVVVNRVHKLFRKEKIGNIRFTPLPDFVVSESNFQSMREPKSWAHELE